MNRIAFRNLRDALSVAAVVAAMTLLVTLETVR
jgi:hypothetical protein